MKEPAFTIAGYLDGQPVMYVDDDAPSAFVRGTRIVKTVKEDTDSHDVGAPGIVAGSIAIPADCPRPSHVPAGSCKVGYWVIWKDSPLPCFVMDFKIGQP